MTSHDHIQQQRTTSRPRPEHAAPSTRTAIAIGGLAWAIVAVSTPSHAVIALAVVPASVAAAHDARAHVVPDHLVAATAWLALIGSTLTAGIEGAVAAAVGALAVGLPHLAVHVTSPARLGFGDVKLAAALGALIGPVAATTAERLFLAMSLTSIASAVGLVVAAVVRRRGVPHAPALVVAAAIVLVSFDRWGAVGT